MAGSTRCLACATTSASGAGRGRPLPEGIAGKESIFPDRGRTPRRFVILPPLTGTPKGTPAQLGIFPPAGTGTIPWTVVTSRVTKAHYGFVFVESLRPRIGIVFRTVLLPSAILRQGRRALSRLGRNLGTF